MIRSLSLRHRTNSSYQIQIKIVNRQSWINTLFREYVLFANIHLSNLHLTVNSPISIRDAIPYLPFITEHR